MEQDPLELRLDQALEATFPAGDPIAVTPGQGARTVRAILIALLFIVSMPLAGAADVDRPLILVAKPDLRDQIFGAAVLVVTPLGGGQHVGFIVNRPASATLGNLFPEHAPSQKVVDPVYLGGPVEPGLIFALVQRANNPGGNSFELMPGLYAAYESAVVDRIIESEPQHARFVAGLVAWRPGELEAEMELGAWHVLEADAKLARGTTNEITADDVDLGCGGSTIR